MLVSPLCMVRRFAAGFLAARHTRTARQAHLGELPVLMPRDADDGTRLLQNAQHQRQPLGLAVLPSGPSTRPATSRSWLNVAKLAGARARPQGELSVPCE